MKMAFVCSKGGESFVKGLEERALKEGNEVRLCHSSALPEAVAAAEWADAVWLEWCDALTVGLSLAKGALDGKRKVVCRIHSYEIFGPAPSRMDWSKVSDLVYVAPHVRALSEQMHPLMKEIPSKVHVVANGVDLDKFKFNPPGESSKIAFLGAVNYKKGPMLLLHAFAELVKGGGDWTLHIGGEVQDMRYVFYFASLAAELGVRDKVFFEGRVDNVPAWFADKRLLVCSSLFESQCMAVLEAMACGVKPLIHNFLGAATLYPNELLWSSIGDFARMAREGSCDSARLRRFVEERHDASIQFGKLLSVLSG